MFRPKVGILVPFHSLDEKDSDGAASLIEMESNRKFNPKIVDAFKMVRQEFDAITKVGG